MFEAVSSVRVTKNKATNLILSTALHEVDIKTCITKAKEECSNGKLVNPRKNNLIEQCDAKCTQDNAGTVSMSNKDSFKDEQHKEI